MSEKIQPSNQNQEFLKAMAELHEENEKLKIENTDLQIALETIAEHGDLIESQLHETNVKLEAEVIERQKAENILQKLINIVSQQRDDLKIILQTTLEHSDVLDNQLLSKLQTVTEMANLDGLTEIANRRRFDQYLEHQWQQMLKQESHLCIILCDIDYFKNYNDAYGHLAGDQCLKQIAKCLSQGVNRSEDLVARYGGEEFAIILPQTKLEEGLNIAEGIQAAINQRQLAHSASLVCSHVTVSMGIADTVPTASRSPNSLLDEADQLLYLAKQQGRNRIAHH